MATTIDRKTLRLVIPVDTEDGVIYVHCEAVSMAVFEQFYFIISRTFTKIFAEGLGVASGPRVAAMIMRDVAVEAGVEKEFEKGLLMEMRRLTNVLAPGERGWETIPLEEAVARGTLDEEEASEVENAMAFFTVACRMLKKSTRVARMEGAAKIWDAQVTFLDCTAYAAGLKTSSTAGSSGGTPPVSSLPS